MKLGGYVIASPHYRVAPIEKRLRHCERSEAIQNKGNRLKICHTLYIKSFMIKFFVFLFILCFNSGLLRTSQ